MKDDQIYLRRIFKYEKVSIATISRNDLIKMKQKLVVTQEAIQDFGRLTPTQRLLWLDQTRLFLSKTLSERTKKTWDKAKLHFHKP